MLGSENHYTYVEVRDALGIIDTEGGAVIRFETLKNSNLPPTTDACIRFPISTDIRPSIRKCTFYQVVN